MATKRLVHRTTKLRADLISKHGPNPRYKEPGGHATNDGFSTYLEQGPFTLRTPEEYARGKANLFKNEGGPAMLVVGVPEDIIALASDPLFPLSQGLVQFDLGAGLEELLAAWPTLQKQVIIVT
jgi:hypothetical protein